MGIRDAGQKPLRGDAALDQAGGRGRLDDALAAGRARPIGAARDDHAELRRDDVEAFADVFPDLYARTSARRAGLRLRFADFVDALEMRRRMRAPPLPRRQTQPPSKLPGARETPAARSPHALWRPPIGHALAVDGGYTAR
jgi:hypothetical protein